MERIKSKDFISGAIFVVVGLATVIIAQNYNMGSLLRMGPGFFPTMVGSLTLLVGALLVIKGLITAVPDIPKLHLGPLLWVVGGLVVFAFTLERLGLIASTFLLVMISRVGSDPVYWRGAFVLSAVLAVIAITIFIYFLGMPIRLLP